MKRSRASWVIGAIGGCAVACFAVAFGCYDPFDDCLNTLTCPVCDDAGDAQTDACPE